MDYPFRNLIFEGGGVKGIAYVGAFQILEKEGIIKDTRRVGGTSAGAINAVLLALGYTLQETQGILMDLDFNNFMDDAWGFYRDSKRLISDFGWYKGDFFKGWIGDRIREKTKNQHSTFLELKNQNYLDLYLVGTNLSTGYSEVFSVEHTPRMRVVDAVRISMSIPLFFAAVRNLRSDVYVDGGLFNNYPIKLFDREKYIDPENASRHTRRPEYYRQENVEKPVTSSEYVYNKETLGFRLDSGRDIGVFRDHAEPEHHELNDFFDYAFALIRSSLKVQENTHLHSDDWHRTIYINTLGVGTTDFDLSAAKKEELILEGNQAAKKYLEWFQTNPSGDRPKNHPDNQD